MQSSGIYNAGELCNIQLTFSSGVCVGKYKGYAHPIYKEHMGVFLLSHLYPASPDICLRRSKQKLKIHANVCKHDQDPGTASLYCKVNMLKIYAHLHVFYIWLHKLKQTEKEK